MLRRKIDYNLEKMETIQISNDAYYNLVFGETCLDGNNIGEVKELKKRFPYGFGFKPGIEYVDDSDLIECTIIPICECSTPFTHYKIQGKWCKEEFYYSPDRQSVHYRFFNLYDHKFIDYGWNDIIINEQNKPEIRPKGCIIPLWGKSWMRY